MRADRAPPARPPHRRDHLTSLRAVPGLPEVRPGDDLAAMLPEVGSDEIVVVSHKVVSKAEGRIVDLTTVEPSDLARALGKDDVRLAEVILTESAAIVARREGGVVISETRHGFVCANAGVDRSNVPGDDTAVLLPLDPDRSARELRARLPNRPGVIISDTFGRAWRVGQVEVAIGIAGVQPVDDWRGRSDAEGRSLAATQLAVADAIAAASELVRAKDSREPVVVVGGLGRYVTDDDGPGAAALIRAREADLFR
ncbi:MAG TPA: coenzyme F420-0:L-glutamate ligase [Thermoleophilaceae bacterium]|nr:coenzyme F420-0:L-glutamate ligase [Thermoleophilaceae bacterium]